MLYLDYGGYTSKLGCAEYVVQISQVAHIQQQLVHIVLELAFRQTTSKDIQLVRTGTFCEMVGLICIAGCPAHIGR